MPLQYIIALDPQALCDEVRKLSKKDDILQIEVQSISPTYHIAWMRVRKGKKNTGKSVEKRLENKEDPLGGLTDLFGTLTEK